MKNTSLLKAIGLALVTVYCSTSTAQASDIKGPPTAGRSINAYNASETTTLYYLERRGMSHIAPGKSKMLNPPLNFYCTDSKVGATKQWRKRRDVQCHCHKNHTAVAPTCEVKSN